MYSEEKVVEAVLLRGDVRTGGGSGWWGLGGSCYSGGRGDRGGGLQLHHVYEDCEKVWLLGVGGPCCIEGWGGEGLGGGVPLVRWPLKTRPEHSVQARVDLENRPGEATPQLAASPAGAESGPSTPSATQHTREGV